MVRNRGPHRACPPPTVNSGLKGSSGCYGPIRLFGERYRAPFIRPRGIIGACCQPGKMMARMGWELEVWHGTVMLSRNAGPRNGHGGTAGLILRAVKNDTTSHRLPVRINGLRSVMLLTCSKVRQDECQSCGDRRGPKQSKLNLQRDC